MRKMTTTGEHTPLKHLAERYWVESRRPLASLVFIAPLLVVYEAGVAWLGAQNGADAFMRLAAGLAGLRATPPAAGAEVCILLAWHHLARQPWRLSGGVLSGMAAESLLLGVCLCLVCLAWGAWSVPPAADIGGEDQAERWARIAGLLGAGIYEELLFRLILLSLLAWGLRRAGVAPWASTLLAVLASSLLFAAAHHVGPYGEEFVRSRFLFRSLAGVFFSVVFIYRGFGIAAGSHAAYDVLVSVL